MTTPKIIYEDSELAVIDKSAHIVVNKADTVKNTLTVQEWAEKEFRIQNSEFKIDEENRAFYDRGGIVHRLDKETSGALIIAKTPHAFFDLQRQFKEGQVEKTYVALVHGRVVQKEGEVKAPIGRLPWNRMRFGILPMGRESHTLYKVLTVWDFPSPLTLLEMYPKTGRTHQIRVHMKYINHPIFADPFYAGRKVARRDRKQLSRHFLHARDITFTHPTTLERVSFTAPLSSELVDFLKALPYTE